MKMNTKNTDFDEPNGNWVDEKWRLVFEFAPDAYYLNDLKGNFVDGNKMAEKLSGYSKDELIGNNFLKLNILPKNQLARAATNLAKNALGKPTGPDNFTIIRKDSKRIEVEITTYPIVIDGNTLVLGIARDITERLKSEKALRTSEAKFRSLFENMQSGFAIHEIVLDESGIPIDYIFLDINEAFEKSTELKREQIIGKKVTEVLPGIENDPADWIGTYGKVALTGESVAFDNYSENLERMYSVVAYRTNENEFAVLFLDITDRMKAEQAIIEAHNTLEMRVKERTAELQTLVNAIAGREVRMAELKQVVRKLRKQLLDIGEQPVADDPLLSFDD